MTRPAGRPFIFLIMIFLLLWVTACAGREVRPTPTLLPCPVPVPPFMSVLNVNDYIASPANVAKLLKNISAQRAYAEGLEITVDCYEKQITLSGEQY